SLVLGVLGGELKFESPRRQVAKKCWPSPSRLRRPRLVEDFACRHPALWSWRIALGQLVGVAGEYVHDPRRDGGVAVVVGDQGDDLVRLLASSGVVRAMPRSIADATITRCEPPLRCTDRTRGR